VKNGKYLYPYDLQQYVFPLVAPLLFPVYFQIMTFRYVFTRKRYSQLVYMIPHYISHFVITYTVFQSWASTIAFFYAARLTESAWFAWVSQCNHICMDVHDDNPTDTWVNLQVLSFHTNCIRLSKKFSRFNAETKVQKESLIYKFL
jgi:uncharacterized protein Veg